MKKAFFEAYKALYHCGWIKTFKAWKTLPEGLKIAVIEDV